MTNRFQDILDQAVQTGSLDEAARRTVQRIVYEDGKVSVQEADMLFAINDAVSEDICPEWPQVFVGAVTDLLVRQSFPADHIDAAESVWLLQRISHDGKVETDTELALLLNVLKYANSVPDTLEKFALDQVKFHVLGNGFVTAEDVEHLRQVLYNCGSSGGVGISRIEAQTLFEIADATVDATNDASFDDLFVGAVANHIMMSAAPAKLSYDESARREYWLHERGEITRGVRRAFRSPGGFFKTFLEGRRLIAEDGLSRGSLHSHAQDWVAPHALREAEAVTGGEARWLIAHLRRDHVISAPERKLLAFLAEESPEIHESLSALIDQAA